MRRAAGRRITLRINPDEVPALRFALDRALSEAHADRAALKALNERMETAEMKGARS